jgi:hypothetical protein
MSDVQENESVVAQDNTANENAAQAAQEEQHAAGEEASPKRTRQTVLDELTELGWKGPTSYTKTHLEEMVTKLRNGETIEVKPRGRKAAAKPEGEGDAVDPTTGAADVQTAEEADQSASA